MAEPAERIPAVLMQMVAADKAETGLLRLDFHPAEAAAVGIPKSVVEEKQPLRDKLSDLNPDPARQLLKRLSWIEASGTSGTRFRALSAEE